jgi:hypothetical protein
LLIAFIIGVILLAVLGVGNSDRTVANTTPAPVLPGKSR